LILRATRFVYKMQLTSPSLMAHQIFVHVAALVTSCHQIVTSFDDMRGERAVLF